MKKMKKMTNEKFDELISEDKWISAISEPVKCCDYLGNFLFYRTCTYPQEYKVTEEQIADARIIREMRRRTILDTIKKGELVFRAMGGDYKSDDPDEVCNHRIRCEFRNSAGGRYFVEFLKGVRPDTFHVDFLIDRDLEKLRQKEMNDAFEEKRKNPEKCRFIQIRDKQDYYLHEHMKTYEKPFTWANVVEFVNDVCGCEYKSARMVEYLVSYDEWVCEC